MFLSKGFYISVVVGSRANTTGLPPLGLLIVSEEIVSAMFFPFRDRSVLESRSPKASRRRVTRGTKQGVVETREAQQ